MKLKVNRNTLWSKIFIDQLAHLGVKYACISPGSRSTPLTYAISQNKKIKSYIHFDERSSAFFGLGIAKVTRIPGLIITTSGTAVAELFPAIIEAYQQRVPLIICTADRPPELIGTGANQTINQHNIYKNHIRWFRDLGLPSISETGLRHLQRMAIKAFKISSLEDIGPVHLNFPFRKPLEHFSYTDEINKKIFTIKPQRVLKERIENLRPSTQLAAKLAPDLIKYERGIILVGPMDYDHEVIKRVKQLSSMLKYPIIADGLSQLRIGNSNKEKNILSNFNAIVKSENFIQKHDPEIIIQYGRTPTSSAIEHFLENTKAKRYLINSFGDNFDPTRNAKAVFAVSPKNFCHSLFDYLSDVGLKRTSTIWLKDYLKGEAVCNSSKIKLIEKANYLHEPNIITEVLNSLPSGNNIFIGNSLPVRDLDNFMSSTSKNFKIYFNRGVSGIDGVTSTALGIASRNKKAILITGDLSFLYDLNALPIAVKYSIPLTILVINNNGGGIFQSLPISGKVNRFNEFFVTPHNLEISRLVKSFGIDYHLISNKRKLRSVINKVLNKNYTSVLEIKTDAVKSVELRNRYFNEVRKKINKEFSV